jgi:hypothetical protein
LADGGLTDIEVIERGEWRKAERALWSAAIGIETADDPALRVLREEAEVILPVFDAMRRVLAVARRSHE